ncbi:hypothetical protein GCM10010359_66220 [Streptomyces morookaense]|uniref:DUF397 domain-containing protein n=1 Tax=Streptomyces morookaense TaxID=1970 RepID=A0A7Y7BBJ9_STRMO|nr:DUF397 domain-containing protein [Streptomyces morookaense]GHF54678.1 hypothetical protein GCM10010359_66220 [Streptomyces morookaense]
MNGAQPELPRWFKSSFSGEDNDNCIEVAYRWRKSSRSASEGGACVEVASAPATVLVRDSKVPDGPRLALTPAAWAAFARSLQSVPRPVRGAGNCASNHSRPAADVPRPHGAPR